jgi:hypothetical protein
LSGMIDSEFWREMSGLCRRTAEISLCEAKMKNSWRQPLAGMRHLCHIPTKRSSMDFDWLIEIIIISSSRSGSQRPVYQVSYFVTK